jgi:hypothetical protein
MVGRGAGGGKCFLAYDSSRVGSGAEGERREFEAWGSISSHGQRGDQTAGAYELVVLATVQNVLASQQC